MTNVTYLHKPPLYVPPLPCDIELGSDENGPMLKVDRSFICGIWIGAICTLVICAVAAFGIGYWQAWGGM